LWICFISPSDTNTRSPVLSITMVCPQRSRTQPPSLRTSRPGVYREATTDATEGSFAVWPCGSAKLKIHGTGFGVMAG
jgi:hypothetical protein